MKSRVRFLVYGLALTFLPMPSVADSVILLHGLARSERSMLKLENALLEQGYCVQNISYESTRNNVASLAELAIAPALTACAEAGKVNFVTHSLGGILVRHYLQNHQIDNLGRVVMLGPPNKGSEVVDKLRDFPGFHFFHGDAGLELGTGATSVPNKLGSADFDLGIIAGTRSVNLFLSGMIPGVDDGKVSVENTKLDGMRDHLEMEVTHTFMMRNDKVIDQVLHYLKTGKFKRE